MRALVRGGAVPASSGAGGGAPTGATYIVQTAHGDLTAEQALSVLASGVVKNTTATGVLSVATVDTAEITNDAVTYAKVQNVTATDKLLGRSTIGAGDVEEIACTAAGRALLDDAAASDQRTTLGLGTIATQAANAVSITGGSVTGITDLAIADGGTGASTATNAFDALAPTTTQGDLIYHNGTDNVRLAKGTAAQVLKMNAGVTAPEWGSSKSLLLFGAGAAAGHSPADATTYYFSASFGFDPSATTDATAGIVMPACTITGMYITVSIFGTLGSAGNGTFVVRKNSATDSTSVAVAFTAATNSGNDTALGFAVAAGDRVYMKFTTPTWATNPTVVFYGISLIVEFP